MNLNTITSRIFDSLQLEITIYFLTINQHWTED